MTTETSIGALAMKGLVRARTPSWLSGVGRIDTMDYVMGKEGSGAGGVPGSGNRKSIGLRQQVEHDPMKDGDSQQAHSAAMLQAQFLIILRLSEQDLTRRGHQFPFAAGMK
jgi:hypothetical protein